MFSRLRDLTHSFISYIPSTDQLKHAYGVFKKEMFETAKQTNDFMKYMMGVSDKRSAGNVLLTWSCEFVQGAVQILNVVYRNSQKITPLEDGKLPHTDTMGVMSHSLRRNLKILGLAVMYQVSKAVLVTIMYGKEDQSKQNTSSYLESSVSFFISVPVYIYTIGLFTEVMTENTIRNLSVAKTVQIENPLVPRYKLEENDTPFNSFKADMVGSLEYWINLFSINMLPSFIAMLLHMLNDGQALTSAQLAGLSRQHRLEILKKNKAYALGHGATLYLFAWLSKKAINMLLESALSILRISNYSGVSGVLVDYLLMTLAYQFHIIAAQKVMAPLPGESENTWGLFPRFLPEATGLLLVTTAASSVVNEQDLSQQQLKSLDPLPILRYRPVVFALKFLPEHIVAMQFYFMMPLTMENIDAYNELNQRPEMRMFFDLYLPSMIHSLKELREMGELTVAQAALTLFNFSRWVSPSFTKWVITAALGIDEDTLALGVHLLDKDVKTHLTRIIEFLEKLANGIPLDKSIIPDKKMMSASGVTFPDKQIASKPPEPHRALSIRPVSDDTAAGVSVPAPASSSLPAAASSGVAPKARFLSIKPLKPAAPPPGSLPRPGQ